MKLGISTYSLTWNIGVPGYEDPISPLTAEHLLCMAADNGVSVVQFADNMPLHRMTEQQLDRLRELSSHLSIDIEVGIRGSEPELLLRYVTIAERLQAKLLRTLITTPELTEAISHIRQTLPTFEKSGISLSIENHGLHTTKQLIGLFDDINHPLIGCCLDTVNSFSALETPEQVIDSLLPYVSNVHVKDFSIARVDHQMGFIITGAPAGQGRLDIPALIERLGQSGKRPNLILEQWTPYQNTVEQTARLELEWFYDSLAYLREIEL